LISSRSRAARRAISPSGPIFYKQAVKIIMDYSPWMMATYSVDRFVGNKKVQGWYLGSKATSGYSEYWKTSD